MEYTSNFKESVNAFYEIAFKRRTINPRNMDPSKKIDENVIIDLLDIANQAPTYKLTQPWEFWVISDDAKVELSQSLRKIYIKYHPEWSAEKLDSKCSRPLFASHIIGIVMRRFGGKEKLNSNLPTRQDEILAVACAVQNLHLAAAAYNIGGFWETNNEVLNSSEIKQLFDLSEEDAFLGFFYLGYIMVGYQVKVPNRIDVNQKIYFLNRKDFLIIE